MAPPSAHSSSAPQLPNVHVHYTKLFVDGEFAEAVSNETFETFDPRTGCMIANVAKADKEDVDIAVKVARKAFNKGLWPRMSGYERGLILYKWAELIEKHHEELAALETLNSGKPLVMSTHVDVPMTWKLVRSIAGWGDKITGNTYRADGPYHALSLYEPIGVVGAIIPWNFPMFMFVSKAAPALIAGCTIVLKPAEQTPLSALYLASLAKEAGLPPGVLNVLPGFGETAGSAIASHMDIDKISFTGSTEVGRLIMKASAMSNLKPVTLELGGKSPLIICDDADLDVAVELANIGTFMNMVCTSELFMDCWKFEGMPVLTGCCAFGGDVKQGQACIASSRVFVQEEIYEAFLKKMAERAKKHSIGDPFDKGVNHGPQISQTQMNTILGYIESGKEEGARVIAGGNRFGNQGFFIEPTVFADVEDGMKIAKEEIFGPVMSVLKFKTLEEVVERANATTYGLAGGVVTKNMDVANKLSRSIRSGVVWVNCYLFLDAVLPFGGCKMSGFGRENGIHGILNYMNLKCVVTPLRDSPWL